ncbi:Ribosomal RNA small subunit methyltransferase D [Starkeya nomas]|uniref:Ribosomal RNA small subunit methyltransferase D n=2 Tax=Xanthobacteraceae TaxID=335928 RepID=A0A5S9Q319_9HYPH|nr:MULTISPECIES: 16S rRNA (guanine(966)-N(2))-methyltransferase RsmD [Xanthobacteraceae]TSJ64304.1 16S rRNA (guanine(966)-N(2))-methyltransferase RsmD [Ancylobacter moscoviensis]CAA0111241.1 Ribosomal RNA small subunit methyltransferase D [Starkeya nomas]
MRIVGGRFKGRALRGPSSNATRPTSDRLREALFNVLAHAYDDAADGARVLDLFAGTGALGLEALSRGATFAVFVDEAPEPRGLIRANVETLGVGGITRIFRRDATKLGAALASDAFDLVFCDPPYGRGLAEKALASAREGNWLAPGALVIVEEATEAAFQPPDGFEELERRRYDGSEAIFLRAP